MRELLGKYRRWAPVVPVSLSLLPLVPAPTLAAQQGRIAYEFVVKNDLGLDTIQVSGQAQAFFDRIRESVGEARVSNTLLLFNAGASVMLPVPDEEEETPSRRPGRNRFEFRMDGNPAALVEIMRVMESMPRMRTVRDEALHTYTDLATGDVVEVREFLGRKFKVTGERPALDWKLGSEQRQYLGYLVQKATAERDSSLVEAWFSPQIPVPGGPGSFGGLPGMILMINIDDGRVVYAATEVDLTDADDGGVIAPPEEGQEVSREEYDEIVAERMEEMTNRMRRGGRRRPPG